MRHVKRISTAVLCASGLAACHHNARNNDPNDVTYRADTTTTYSASSAPATYSDTTAMARGSMSTQTSTGMSANTSMRPANGAARSERREVIGAIRSLDRARYALEHASHEFGGHRTGALKAVDGALVELRMAAGQEARPQTARVERVEAKEIHQAVVDLERARRDMESAKHNFGGRKTETLKAVDAALSELRLAADNEK